MMTHDRLVQVACGWLGRDGRCSIVVTKVGTKATKENPDAIGWRRNGGVVAISTRAVDPIQRKIEQDVSAAFMALKWGCSTAHVNQLKRFVNIPSVRIAKKMAVTLGWTFADVMNCWGNRVTRKKEAVWLRQGIQGRPVRRVAKRKAAS